ncbi:MAG: fibrinogen-like YCDxxxxGGGW domain-containing protein [Kofleriaceae bacterium]
MCRCLPGFQDHDLDGDYLPGCATCSGGAADDCTSCAPGTQDADGDGTCLPDCATAAPACGTNAACTEVTGEAACACLPGYQDLDGDGDCLADCATAGCGSNTSCDDSTGAPVCSCLPGFQDHDLDGDCLPDCASTTCGVSAACDDASGTAVCSCLPGFQDHDLDGDCAPDCASTSCGANTTCADATGTAVCSCLPGHQDHDLDGDCLADCANAGCGTATACDDGTGVAVCTCLPGFQDHDADGDCLPDCASTTCGSNTSCDDGSGMALCACLAGFQDRDLDGDCLPDCASTTCGTNTSCADGSGTAVCSCLPGFQDHDLDGDCQPNCASTTCGANTSCADGSGIATCSCLPGFQDNDGNGDCLPTCATAGCGTNTSCTDASGTAVCSCLPGFQDNDGNGDCLPTCASTTCGDNTTCTDGSGTAVCSCLPGYEDPDMDGDCAEPTLACGSNLLRGVEAGGQASVVAQTQTGSYTEYRTTLGSTCAEAWYAKGTLCDEPPDVDSQTASTKSDPNSGATWRPNGDSSGAGILVIDVGSVVTFDLLQTYQMFSDGKTTHIRFAIHPATGATPPGAADPGWVLLSAGYEAVGAGVQAGNTVTSPSSYSYGNQTTRYLRIEARNDGSLGSPNYLELRAVKMFQTACPSSCRDVLTAAPGSPDGVYTIEPTPGTPVEVYCDMTTDGGGWTKILQYPTAPFTDSTGAIGTIAVATNLAAAKLADADINGIAFSGVLGRGEYRLKGDLSTKTLYLTSDGPFVDTQQGWGFGDAVAHTVQACEVSSYAACAYTTIVTGSTWIDTLHWGLAGDTCDRYFMDHGATQCWGVGTYPQRCVSAGASCPGQSTYAPMDDFTLWLRPQ